jgi:S-formylglutathione hydrolase FrmB
VSERALQSVGPPWHRPLRGRLDDLVIDSEALRGNPLGDPTARPLLVYTPPSVDDASARLPAIYLIQGFTGQVDMWRNRSAFRPNVIELIDALFSDPSVPPCLVVMVDCWTSLGGSQFVDSPGTGPYHTFLCDEVVSFVDARFPTLADPGHRAITGKSSGGYGAMITPMLRPDVFGAMATHAGDALFELCYWKDVPDVVRALRDEYLGSYDSFLADIRTRPMMSQPTDAILINMWAMAAAYSTDDDGTVRLPFDVRSGRMIPEVWERWLACDPVRMVPGHADALRSLRAIYIDAGTRDEWFLELGAVAFRDALTAIGVTDAHFELFNAGHMGIEYRYPTAMRYLAEHMAAPRP